MDAVYFGLCVGYLPRTHPGYITRPTPCSTVGHCIGRVWLKNTDQFYLLNYWKKIKEDRNVSHLSLIIINDTIYNFKRYQNVCTSWKMKDALEFQRELFITERNEIFICCQWVIWSNMNTASETWYIVLTNRPRFYFNLNSMIKYF